MKRLIIFGLILLFEATAVALTAAACRLALKRGRRPGWYLALPGAIGAAVLVNLATESNHFLFEVVHPNDDGHWGHLTESGADVVWLFVWSMVIAAIPVWLVVRHAREKFSDRTQRRNSLLVIAGTMAAVALLLLHFRDDRLQIDIANWHHEESIGDVVWSSAWLAGGATVLTWLAGRWCRRKFSESGHTSVRIGIAMGSILAFAILLLHFQQTDIYLCNSCLASQHIWQWRFGLWPRVSVPLASRHEAVINIRLCRDFFPADHAHRWKLACTLPRNFFGTMRAGFASGDAPRPNSLFHQYEWAPAFRRYVETRLQNGSLSRSKAVELISSHREMENPGVLEREADAMLQDYYLQQ